MLQLTSVGYGDISPITDVETIYGIFVMLIGSAVHASLFSSFVSFITLANRHETSFTNKMDGIRSQMRYMRLPDQHTNKVELYYEYIHLCHKGLLNSGQYFFKDLPLPLQLEVCSYLHGETVESVAIFGGVSESFVRAVVVRLLPLICIPNEFIVYTGDLAHPMVSWCEQKRVVPLVGLESKNFARMETCPHFAFLTPIGSGRHLPFHISLVVLICLSYFLCGGFACRKSISLRGVVARCGSVGTERWLPTLMKATISGIPLSCRSGCVLLPSKL